MSSIAEAEIVAKKKKIYGLKVKFAKFIKQAEALEEDKPKKQAIAIELLKFLQNDGMLLIENSLNFKSITIEKCKEFQQVKNPELYKTCQELLDMIQENKN